MSEKEVKDIKAEEMNVEKEFKFGIAPSLIINMVKENRVYRFEMPIGAKLDECEQACIECQNVIKKMIEEAKAKEAKAKEESESADEDLKKEDK